VDAHPYYAASWNASFQPIERQRERKTKLNMITTKDGMQIYFKHWGSGKRRVCLAFHFALNRQWMGILSIVLCDENVPA
jgi:hypothetical protein